MGHFVYWIRRESDTDVSTSGYVGITGNTKKRWRQHINNAINYRDDCPILSNAIRKYGLDLIYEVLQEGDAELCEFIELLLRPTPGIGWNVAVGGGMPMLNRKHATSSIQKIKAYKITDEQRLKMSVTRKGVRKSEEHKIKIGLGNKGKVLSENTKSKISEAKKGSKVPLLCKSVKASTGEIFNSITEAGVWATSNRSSIRKCINGWHQSAGKHPITKEKLIWKELS